MDPYIRRNFTCIAHPRRPCPLDVKQETSSYLQNLGAKISAKAAWGQNRKSGVQFWMTAMPSTADTYLNYLRDGFAG